MLCPVCNKKEVKIITKIYSSFASLYFASKNNNKSNQKKIKTKIENLWKKDFSEVFICNNCTFKFANPFVSGDGNFYNLAFPVDKNPSDKFEFHRAEKILDSLNKDELSKMNLVEIGPGEGNFLDLVVDKFHLKKSNILAVEISETFIKKLKSKNYFIFPDLYKLKQKKFKNKFDIICLFQTLEHLNNLSEIRKILNFISKKGTHLFISVPSDKKTDFLRKNKILFDIPPEHVGGWSKKSFISWLKESGWNLKEHSYSDTSLGISLRSYANNKFFTKMASNKTLANRIVSTNNPKVSNFYKRILLNYYKLFNLIKVYFNKNKLPQAQFLHFVKN